MQIKAIANASAASCGFGKSFSLKIFLTVFWINSFFASHVPVMYFFISFGVSSIIFVFFW